MIVKKRPPHWSYVYNATDMCKVFFLGVIIGVAGTLMLVAMGG